MNNTTTEVQRVKKFINFNAYAKQWLKDNHIKVSTAYVEGGDYNEAFVYLNRVSNYDPNKSSYRVLVKGKDTVKNCIKITFDTERVDKNQIEFTLKTMHKVLSLYANGTCQRAISCVTVGLVLSGAVDLRGRTIKELLY